MKNTVLIGFQIAPGADIDLPRPEKGTLGSSGFDLRANIAREGSSDQHIEIPAGQWKLIPTGLMLQIPLGYEGQVRPRSGLALKYGITVLNAPGTIDSDYRGELGVILINHSTSAFTVEHGQRIAQIVFQIVPDVSFAEYEELSKTERNSGGYGSSGID